MQNEILISATAGETRVAILERNDFTELHIERETSRNVAGTVVLGRVTRVLPGMQAAFVDIGLEKAAFLYAGDYLDESGDSDLEAGDDEDSPRPRRRSRNGNGARVPNIDSILKEGQEILVQVAKEPIGTKGARITSHVSIPGRHLVLTPWSRRVGVSRRIDSDRERRRLREIVSRARPADLGFIIRTAGDAARDVDLEADVKYLTAVWDEIQAKRDESRAPATLYSELSLPLRVIRDFASGDTKRIVIDDAGLHEEMRSFVDRFVADPKPEIEHYQGAAPIFDHFDIESAIDSNLGKKVWLKSGGYLIVDQSEALTAIDVNTGRYVGKRDLEETVLKTNLEAVKEVVHQLRFRNIGGLIIIDLIDMEPAENREKVYRALQDALRQDKARTNILKISELGLVEMTRKRTRENLVQQLCEPCSNCEGRGYVLSRESVAYKVLREIRKDLPRFCGRQIGLTVNTGVAEFLLGPGRKALATLGQDLEREIEVRARPGLHQEQFEVTALDEGPPVELSLRWLEGPRDEAAEKAPAVKKAGRRKKRGSRAAKNDEPAPEALAEETASTEEAAPANLAPEGEVSAIEAEPPEPDGPAEPDSASADALPAPPDEAPLAAAPVAASPAGHSAPAALALAPEAPLEPPGPVDGEGESPILPPSEDREER